MSVTININGLTLCHKGSNGVTHNTVPDTCYNAKKNPIDFDNEAHSSDLADGTTTVFADGGMMIANFGCNFAKSTLDEGGVGGGVRSGTHLAEAEFMTHSPSVFFEGMPACRLTDKMWMNHKNTVNMAGLMQTDLPPPPGKKERYEARKKLIEEGKASSDPAQQAAAKRLEKNNIAVEQAKLSQHVYDPSKPAPDGWKNISNDPDALSKYKLNPKDLTPDGSQFRAQVYEPDAKVFGTDMKPTVVFKGTTPTSGMDWLNNGQQAFGVHSEYYKNAVSIGDSLRRSGKVVDIAGHSLGGGMASAASNASGMSATTFNSAGLNSGTVPKYHGTSHMTSINAYRVEGEFLTAVQEGNPLGRALGLVSPLIGLAGQLMMGRLAAPYGLLPDAVGTPHSLPGTGVNPIDRHGMDQVIDGIESQKAKDQAVLQNSKSQKL